MGSDTLANRDGTSITGSTGDVQFTTGGVEFTVAFSAFATSGNGCGGPCATTLSSAITTTLEGVDIVGPNGAQQVADASFTEDGVGTIDLTPTPEPSAIALLGTGLIGLVPFARRPKR